jgi:3-hydroxyacyl-CoA dehydrogenase
MAEIRVIDVNMGVFEMNDRIAVDTVYNFINVRIQRREPEQPKPAQEGAVEVKAEEKPAEQPSGENKE